MRPTRMHRKTLPLVVLIPALSVLLVVGELHAQSCLPGSASGILDINNVHARLFNNGGLFWNGGSPLYEVPRGSGPGTLTASWSGGSCTVGPSTINTSVQHFYCTASGELLSAVRERKQIAGTNLSPREILEHRDGGRR